MDHKTQLDASLAGTPATGIVARPARLPNLAWLALPIAAFCCAPAFADDAATSASGGTAVAPPPLTLRLNIRSDDSVKTRRFERRLRIVRYAAQLVDGLVSSAGYRRYGRTCLPCIALAKSPYASHIGHNSLFSLPAEADPAIQPISHGGFAMLVAGGVVYDLVDAQLERHWSPERRVVADTTEIALHAWGASTWQEANQSLAAEEQRASNCAQLWTVPATNFANYHSAVGWCLARYADIDAKATHLLPATLQGAPRP